MSSPRMKIRCPSCGKDGGARAELLNRRVACKHCRHVFRAVAIDEPADSRPAPPAGARPAEPPRPSKDRIEALEREVRRLRDDLSAGRAEAAVEAESLGRREAEAPPAALAEVPAEVLALRDDLARSAGELGEARRVLDALRLERDRLDAARSAELAALRDELEAAFLERDEAVALRDRLIEEVGALRSRIDGPGMPGDWADPGTELQAPEVDAESPTDAEVLALPASEAAVAAEPSTVFDGNPDSSPFAPGEAPRGPDHAGPSIVEDEARRLDPAEPAPTSTPTDGGTWTAWP